MWSKGSLYKETTRRARLKPRTSRSGIRSFICLATRASKASHEDIHCSIVKSFLTKTLLDGSRSKLSKTLGMTQSCRVYFYIYFFFTVVTFNNFEFYYFFADVAEEHERLELRSRTEVRMTEGDTEESVIYKFTGKAAQN